ncbi:MAG: RluA family pseudouridine synthase [Alphaproteobacteria bacterium]|nr:RluA family pseudouridine synthase [Alphaproteobacteria bacterium]
MSEVKIVKVKAVDDGMRLNRWFLKYYPDLPMSRLQKLLRTKQIKVEGKRAEVSTKLVEGQEVRIPPITVTDIEERYRPISPKDTDFMQRLVIYKDDNILILNKPSGIAVQGGRGITKHIDGLLDALMYELDERPKLVHRIDKETSGLLVLARNRKFAEILTKAFREHTIQKTYLALVYGQPKKAEGQINAPIDKVGDKNAVTTEGKTAITDYKIVDNVGNKFSLIEANPVTGRTHQIRVHLEHLGTPIVGDDKYYGETRQNYENFARKLHLHAYKIDLSSIYGKKKIIEAELPEYFMESLDAVGINFKGI